MIQCSRILAADGVEDASRYTSRQGYDTVCYGNTSLSGGLCHGNRPELSGYLQLCGKKKVVDIDGNDYAKYRKVAILDQDCASLSVSGREDAIGKTIEISGEPYIVIGIADKKDGF